MYNRSFRKAASLVLITLMTFGTFMLAGCGKSYEHIFGDVEWLSTYKESSSDTEKKTIKDTFYYSDDWFSDYSNFDSNDPDDCNYTWASKTAGDTKLIAVVMQSINDDWEMRNKAWKQNFTVNEPGVADPSGEHYAYAKAVEKIIDDVAALSGGSPAT